VTAAPVTPSSSRAAVASGLIGLALAGCAGTLSADNETDAARVVITIDPARARDCAFMGTASADNEGDLQRKAAWIGGDVAVVTRDSQETRASTAWYRSVTSLAEVFRCEGAR
jgi:hypothetical protein